jgi:hypothetical protein
MNEHIAIAAALVIVPVPNGCLQRPVVGKQRRRGTSALFHWLGGLSDGAVPALASI